MIHIDDSLALDDSLIEERFAHGSGPGGQNVNKVATAVELRFDVRASSLPDDVKQRLRGLAGSRMTSDDVLLIDSREHCTQKQNREAARDWLSALVRQALRPPKKRRRTKPTAAAREKRLVAKEVAALLQSYPSQRCDRRPLRWRNGRVSGSTRLTIG